jgi:hypothetical protein
MWFEGQVGSVRRLLEWSDYRPLAIGQTFCAIRQCVGIDEILAIHHPGIHTVHGEQR